MSRTEQPTVPAPRGTCINCGGEGDIEYVPQPGRPEVKSIVIHNCPCDLRRQQLEREVEGRGDTAEGAR